MKKRALSLALALVMCLGLTIQASAVQPDEAYQAMIALKSQYPEGTPWTNDNSYDWNGGIYSGGQGCAGFAFMLSDAAFGDLPARMLYAFSLSDVRVGDILRVNGDTHSVIVLEVYSDHAVIAEGNYSSSIHWGRSLSKAEVERADYLMTRYPETADQPVDPQPAAPPADTIPASGTAVASTQTVTVDGRKVEFQMYALVDASGNGTNYIKLRDLGKALGFNVGWSKEAGVFIESDKPYSE